MPKKAPLTYGEISRLTGSAIKESVSRFQLEFDTNMINTVETGGACIGIPLPSLALEWLLDTTIWPLGRVVQCNGLEASMKSGFSYELSRIFRKFGGITNYHETEGKFAETLCRSIVGWHAETAFLRDQCDSMNDWQKKLLFSMRNVRLIMDGTGKRNDRGIGRIFPALEVIDSLTAKNLESSDERIEKAGFAQSAHPTEAGSITKYMKMIQKILDRYPVALLLINHLKLQEQQGSPQPLRHRPGGKHVAFHETVELEFKNIGKIDLKDKEGVKIKVRCRKNNLGTNDHQIEVPVRWWYTPQFDANVGREVRRQKTGWYLHEATVNLITHPDFKYRGDVKEVLDFQVNKKRYSSKRLKIRKDDPVSVTAFGRAIFKDVSLMAELRSILGIKVRPVLDPRIGYSKQQATARTLIDEYTEKQDDELPAEKIVVRSRVGSSGAAGAATKKPARKRRKPV